jgi:hypothetical protein
MTNPIQLLEQKLEEIKQIEDACHKAENYFDLGEIQRQKQMYISSIHILKNNITIKK